MSLNLNSLSSSFRGEVDLSKTTSLSIPTMVTNLLIESSGLSTSAGVAGICRVEGDVVSDSAYQTTYTAGVPKVASGSFSSFGIHIGTRTLKGAFSVANNKLIFTSTNLSLLNDTCVTCSLTVSPATGGVQIDKNIRYVQSSTGTTSVDLGVVSQKTGSSLAGEMIVHNIYSGLSYPQSSTFMVKTALSAGKVVLLGAIAIKTSKEALNQPGSLRIKLVETTSSTAISKSLLPSNKSAFVYFDVYKISDNGDIIVNDPSGIINGAAATTFFGTLYAQGGFANIKSLNSSYGHGLEGLPSVTIKKAALAGQTASITLRRDISLNN